MNNANCFEEGMLVPTSLNRNSGVETCANEPVLSCTRRGRHTNLYACYPYRDAT